MTTIQLTGTPVTWDEIKAFVRADSDQDQVMLEGLAKMATDEFISASGYIPATATITVVDYLGSVSAQFAPMPTPSSVEVDGTALAPAKYSWDPVGRCLTPAADVVGLYITVTFDVDNTACPEDVKLAILQRTKEAYDYGDNLEQKGPRYFDRIANRYRDDYAN